jgi:hypothetical protein
MANKVVRYSIWHLGTGNLIGDYPIEAAALDAVRDELQLNTSPDLLVLQREGTDTDPQLIASGPTLATRALRSARPSALPDRSPAGS